eukprot:scaffold19984_cov65-Phaeocystis_antarctica.AAC.4
MVSGETWTTHGCQNSLTVTRRVTLRSRTFRNNDTGNSTTRRRALSAVVGRARQAQGVVVLPHAEPGGACFVVRVVVVFITEQTLGRATLFYRPLQALSCC